MLEDEVLWRRHLVAFLEGEGYAVTGVGNLAEARRMLGSMAFDWVLLDVNLPDGSSLDLLRDGVVTPTLGTVVMTAEGGVATAVDAMRLGASDFLAKPFEAETLPLVFGRVAGARREARLRKHERAAAPGGKSPFFFGPHHGELRGQLDRILAADARLGTRLPPLLLQGETGTGKSALARWIHEQGPRAEGPFVEVNCAALPEHLVESELFGYEKGAFTDARTDRLGLFEAASGGTLFLDEIGSLTLSHQAKILTAVEEFAIRRVGGSRTRSVDCRLIAATLEDLPKAVEAGRFRDDLLHRLSLLVLHLPPLRAHPEAAEATAEYLLTGLLRRYRLPKVKLPEAARAAMRGHPWPGNVRELAHELERALIYSQPGTLELDGMGRAGAASAPGTPTAATLRNPVWQLPEDGFSLESALSDLERSLIDEALAEAEGNLSAAARRLGVSRDFLRYRVKTTD